MKKPLVVFFGFAFIIMLLYVHSYVLYLASDHRISSEKIKKIKLGMSARDVISIFGQPLDIKDKYLKDGKTYTYTKPIDYTITYPIALDSF